MADSLGDTDDRDITREIVGGRIGDAATRPGGAGPARRRPPAHTYEPARIARQGADEAFRRASSAARHPAAPEPDRDGPHGEPPSQRLDAPATSARRPASGTLGHADADQLDGPGDDPYHDARPHRAIRATVRWSLAIVVTVGVTYLLATQLLAALGGMPS